MFHMIQSHPHVEATIQCNIATIKNTKRMNIHLIVEN